MKHFYTNSSNLISLLDQFNNREKDAFGAIYSLIYKELYYFTHSLYKGSTTDATDIIQDVFVDIWEDKKRKFETITGLRSFIYVVIKNKFIKHYRHMKVVNRVSDYIIKDMSKGYAIEAEIYSLIPEALGLLPEECAKSFKLFLEGYDIKEIAKILGKQPSTIYNQRKEAISILRKKLPKYKLFVIVSILRI